jgi:selenocysteine-specific elongation factor
VILDPLARRPLTKDVGRAKFLEIVRDGNRDAVLAAMVERAAIGLRYEEIGARLGWRVEEISSTVKAVTATGSVRKLGDQDAIVVDGRRFETLRNKIFETVEVFRRQNPLLPGIAREDLRSRTGRRVRAEVFRAALDELVDQKKLETQGETVRRTGTGISLLPEELEAKEKIENAFRSAGLTVPSVKEVLSGLTVESKRAEKLLQILLREKNLQRISADLIFHSAALAHLREQLSAYKKAKGQRISVPGFKDLAGITRKYAIPLLEYLDRERVTRRIGEERVIL